MNNLQLIRFGVQITSALGVQRVVTQVIRNNTIILSTTDKILVTAGSVVFGSMAGDAALKHVNGVMNSIVDQFNKNNS